MKRYLFTLFLMVFGLYLVAEDTPYAGKTMAVIGDSYVANHRRPKAETWHSRVAERLGMSYLNFGRNGGCIAFDPNGDHPTRHRRLHPRHSRP